MVGDRVVCLGTVQAVGSRRARFAQVYRGAHSQCISRGIVALAREAVNSSAPRLVPANFSGHTASDLFLPDSLCPSTATLAWPEDATARFGAKSLKLSDVYQVLRTA